MFLNPVMLVFLGAAVVPLVLHLLSRARQDTVRWGAMMFLEDVSPRRSAVRRVRQVALLVVRCGAVAAVALALARPVTGGGGGLGGGGALSRASVVVVADTSGSTGAAAGGAGTGSTRLDAVREAATRVLASLAADDAVALLVPGEATLPTFTTDRGETAARVAALRPTGARTDVAAALKLSARLLQGQPAGGPRVIVVVTDRQASSFAGIDGDFATSFAGVRIESGVTRVVFVPAGDADRDNLWVKDVRVGDGGRVPRGVPVEVAVTVRNEGDTPRPGVAVTVSAAGAGEARGRVDLAPDSEGTCRVMLTFGGPGGRALVTATVPPGAGPRFDDRAEAVAEVTDGLRVLVVARSERGGGGETPAGIALAPFGVGGQGGGQGVGANPARVTYAGNGRVPEFGLGAYGVVLVPQLTSLSEGEARAIAQHVYGGGGLVVGLGPETESSAIRRLEGVLPAAVGGATSPDGLPGRVLAGEGVGGVLSYAVRGAEVLPGATVDRRRELGAVLPGGRVVLEVEGSGGGGALLVEGRYGAGRVIVCGVPLEGPWWDGPRSTGYVPLVQSVVRAAAGSGVAGGVVVAGEAAEVTLALPEGADVRSLSVEMPGGQRGVPRVERRDGRATAAWGPAREPGVYWFRFRAGGRERAEPVAVRADARESDLSGGGSEPGVLARAALLTGADVIDPEAAGDPEAELARVRHGRELWPLLLGLALAALAIEQGLLRYWARPPGR